MTLREEMDRVRETMSPTMRKNLARLVLYGQELNQAQSSPLWGRGLIRSHEDQTLTELGKAYIAEYTK